MFFYSGVHSLPPCFCLFNAHILYVSRHRTRDGEDKLVLRIPLPEAMEQYFKKMPLKTGDDEWFNKSWPESESEEEDSRQTAGEATMGASTARRRSDPRKSRWSCSQPALAHQESATGIHRDAHPARGQDRAGVRQPQGHVSACARCDS